MAVSGRNGNTRKGVTILTRSPASFTQNLPEYKVWLTYLLLAITVGMFGVELAIEGGWDALSFERSFRTATLFKVGALYRPAIDNGEFGRLLAVMFVHASLLHLLLNGALLLALGWRLESYLGAARLALIYLLTGLGASVLSYGLTLHSRDMAVGASGAIFGLGGALVGFSWRNRAELARQGWFLCGVLALNLTLVGTVPGTDNWAHLGGLAGGLWLGLLGLPRFANTPPAGAPARSPLFLQLTPNLLLASLTWGLFIMLLFFLFY